MLTSVAPAISRGHNHPSELKSFTMQFDVDPMGSAMEPRVGGGERHERSSPEPRARQHWLIVTCHCHERGRMRFVTSAHRKFIWKEVTCFRLVNVNEVLRRNTIENASPRDVESVDARQR